MENLHTYHSQVFNPHLEFLSPIEEELLAHVWNRTWCVLQFSALWSRCFGCGHIFWLILMLLYALFQ